MPFSFTVSSGLVIGLTGTRKGMSSRQRTAVVRWLAQNSVEEARHGDCVGADEQFHQIALNAAVRRIVIHPPDNDQFRAYCEGGQYGPTFVAILSPRPYLLRDHAMVNAIEVLLATPATKREVLRSGTWATIRYARKTGCKLVIFPP